MTNPCEACKRKECPERCRSWADYIRGKRKRGIKGYEEKGKRTM